MPNCGVARGLCTPSPAERGALLLHVDYLDIHIPRSESERWQFWASFFARALEEVLNNSPSPFWQSGFLFASTSLAALPSYSGSKSRHLDGFVGARYNECKDRAWRDENDANGRLRCR